MPYKDRDLCSEVRGYVEKWNDKWRDNNETYHYYFNFVMGNQWEDDEQDILTQYNKNPMVMNKLSPLAKHILGEQRMNTPALQVISDNDVPVESITVRQALIKDIAFDSDAKVVYQTAAQQSVIGGFGAYWVGTEYINDSSFDQRPTINAIRDATKCFWDISAETPSKTDGMYAGFIRRMSRAKFKEKYGSKIERSIGVNYGILDSNFVWANDEEVAVVYCQKRKLKRDRMYELSNGKNIYKDDMKTIAKQTVKNMEGEDVEMLVYAGELVTVEKERPIDRYEVTFYEMAGDYVLDETIMPYTELGIVFMDQNSYWDKKGKQICVPYFKDATDAQKFLNYIATQSAYCMKVARYDQYMASKANIKSPETALIWKNPGRYQGALVYDVDVEGGTKPERLNPPEFSSAFITMYERTMRDIETSTGMYGTQLGDQGNEKSGAAIDSRTRQGSYSNYVVFDSINRAIATGARLINQSINKLYDTHRKVNLEMPDTGMSTIELNKPKDEFGMEIENNMTEGEFRIRLLPGPSYEGQQAESIQAMQQILQADPQLFQLIADLYADNLPSNNKVEIRNRLRTIVPPEVIEAGKTGKPMPPKKPQPDPQMELAKVTAQARMADVENKKQKLMLDAQKNHADYQIELQRLETEKLEAAAQLEEQVLRYQAEMHKTNTDENIAHANNMVKILTHLKDPHQPTNRD